MQYIRDKVKARNKVGYNTQCLTKDILVGSNSKPRSLELSAFYSW